MFWQRTIRRTHARLASFRCRGNGRFTFVSHSIFPSREYSGLDEMCQFVDSGKPASGHRLLLHRRAVRNGLVEASNLPWIIVIQSACADELKSESLLIMISSHAWGIPAARWPKDVSNSTG